MNLKFTVTVACSPEDVWKAVRTFRAVNSELFPVLQMSCPKSFLDRPFEEYPLGVFLFHGLVLFLGWIPIKDEDTAHMDNVNLAHKFSLFQDYWRPRIAGEINDSYLKLARLKGEFIWHRHEAEDELFLVVKGRLLIRLRDRDI